MALSSYAVEVLADQPVGYWRLGEAPGSASAVDASGNGNTGSYSGGVTLGLPGFHGGDTAALFDGKDGRVLVLNSDSLNPPFITMEAKIRWDGPNDLQQRVMEKSSFAELAQYGLSIMPDGHVEVEIRTSAATTSVNVQSAAVVAQGVETHIAATYDGQVIRIYLNGVLDPSEPAAPGSISPKPPTPQNLIESGLGIGNQTQRDRAFKGLIDEAAVFAKALSAGRILAHYQAQIAKRTVLQYAVKFVCGKSGDAGIVAPGVYFTAINVHNPLYKSVGFRVKVAIGLPGLKAGPVSRFINTKLGPDEALEIDCPDIQKIAGQRSDFAKGFVVIESSTELDVVAVYTASGSTGQVETLHTERVPARRVEVGTPDLIAIPDAKGSFCRRTDSTLTVTVKNQGTGDAGDSVTEVDFGKFGKVDQPTPALAPGASVDLLFAIPKGCFDPDCEFSITVDVNGQVNESNEGNNVAKGACLG
jgi:hypothetical protein